MMLTFESDWVIPRVRSDMRSVQSLHDTLKVEEGRMRDVEPKGSCLTVVVRQVDGQRARRELIGSGAYMPRDFLHNQG